MVQLAQTILMLVYFSFMSMAFWRSSCQPLVVGGAALATPDSCRVRHHFRLAVLNIITGIFVTDAVDMAASDHELMVEAG